MHKTPAILTAVYLPNSGGSWPKT